jgi:hypothetical protein
MKGGERSYRTYIQSFSLSYIGHYPLLAAGL